MQQPIPLTPIHSLTRPRHSAQQSRPSTGLLRALVNVIPLLLITVSAGQAAETLSQAERAKLASEVKTIFVNKCAKCHGPEGIRKTEKPKGELDYILDLAKLATSPRLIVPGDPDESKLYNMVADLIMPDDSAGEEPLPDDEIQLISRWIKLGAPTEKGTPAVMKFDCPATKQFDSKNNYTAEQIRQRMLSTRLEELPEGIFLDRCSSSESAGKVICNRQKVDRVEYHQKLQTKKFYVFGSLVNFQLFPNLTSITDDGAGGVQYGKCEYISR